MDGFRLDFHHVGILVSSTNLYLNSVPRRNSYTIEIFDDPIQCANLTLVHLPGYFLELIEPYHDSILYPELKKKENQIHHLCFIIRDEDSYNNYIKHSIKISGPFYSIMFDAEIEFYVRTNGLIEEIVKKFT
jgi:hypothetical protein